MVKITTPKYLIMRTEINFFSEQLSQVYNGKPWYGDSINDILNSFPAVNAFDYPVPKTHNAAELVAHIIAYRHFLNNRLGGDNDFLPDQEATFDWKAIVQGGPNVWKALNDELADSQKQLLNLLSRQDDTLLDQKVTGKPYDFRYLIYGVIRHDIYHLGQISYIKRFYKEQDKVK